MRLLAAAALLAVLCGASTAGCAAGQQSPAQTYARYEVTCCPRADTEGEWHPGDTLTLHWIVERSGESSDPSEHAMKLTAVLTGPYGDVNALKAGAAARRSVTAVVLSVTDGHPGTPVSHIALPSDLPTGYYNLSTTVGYASGSQTGATIIQVAAASP